MSGSIGSTLRLTLFGRSHGPSVGMTLTGVPAGKTVSMDELQAFLKRRAPGHSPLSTSRRFPAVSRTARPSPPSSTTPTCAPRIIRICPPCPAPVTPTTPPM